MLHQTNNTIFYIIIIALTASRLYSNSLQYSDCTVSCSFPNTVAIKANNPIQYIQLPQIFQLTYEVQIAGAINPFPIFGNIIEIYSTSLKKSLVSISLSVVNQISVSYNGKKVNDYFPPVTFSDTDFAFFSLTIHENKLTFGNEYYAQSYPIISVIGGDCILYASYFEDAGHHSAGGNVNNIFFTGFEILILSVIISIIIIVLYVY